MKVQEVGDGRFLMSVDDFQEQGAAWAAKTFPVGTVDSALEHLRRETLEAAAHPSDIVEFADCLILLLRACSLAGHRFSSVFAAARKKQLVNEEREWGQPDAHGVVEHVRVPAIVADGVAELAPGPASGRRFADSDGNLFGHDGARLEALDVDGAIANGDAR